MLLTITIDTIKDDLQEVVAVLDTVAKLYKPATKVCSRRNDCPVGVKCEGVNKIFIDDCTYFEDGGTVS